MSCVHYKFSSKLNYDTVTFDGLHISLCDLKKQIMGREKLKAADSDLQITNAQTKEGKRHMARRYLLGQGGHYKLLVRGLTSIPIRCNTQSFIDSQGLQHPTLEFNWPVCLSNAGVISNRLIQKHVNLVLLKCVTPPLFFNLLNFTREGLKRERIVIQVCWVFALWRSLTFIFFPSGEECSKGFPFVKAAVDRTCLLT